MLKYISEALNAQACSASVVAAAGSPLLGPTLKNLAIETGMAPLVSSGTSGEVQFVEKLVCDRVAAAVEDIETKVYQALTGLQAKTNEWRAMRDQQWGGVVATGSDKRHEVLLGDVCFPLDLWVTRCGWRFGGSPHRRVGGGSYNCRKCLAACALSSESD